MPLTRNSIARGKDLPDQRNFVKNNVSSQIVLSPFTISGATPSLIFDDTNNENFSINVDADILTIRNDTGPIDFIRFRGGANDDIQVDRPITFNSTVSGLTFGDITLTDASPTITFNDTVDEDFTIGADSSILSIINTTGPITFIRFRGGANDDIQVDRPITFNSTVSGLTFTDITLSDTSPTITFTDTTAGDDDYTIAVDGDLMTITNLTTSDAVIIGPNPVLQITPTGSADVGLTINAGSSTSAGVTKLQIVDETNVQTNFSVTGGGQTRASSGYPTNLTDSPTSVIVFGGQYQQNVSTVGNVGTGVDDLHSYTIDAFVLANDGDSLDFIGGGTVLSAGGNKQIFFNVGGTTVFGTGTFDPAADSEWSMRITVIRIDSDSIIASCIYSDTNGNTVAIGNSTQVNALTFSGTITMKWQAESADAVDNRITQNFSVVRKFGRS